MANEEPTLTPWQAKTIRDYYFLSFLVGNVGNIAVKFCKDINPKNAILFSNSGRASL